MTVLMTLLLYYIDRLRYIALELTVGIEKCVYIEICAMELLQKIRES